MPLSYVKELLSNLKSIGCEKVVLIGGEPTLHPEIIEILSECREQHLNVSIVSNGLYFANKTFCENVLTASGNGLDITLSMATFPVESHNAKTNESRIFKKFEQGFHNLRHYGKNPNITVVISSTSISHLSDVFFWLAENEIDYVSFSVGVPSITQDKVDGTHTVNPQEIGKIVLKLFRAGQILGIKTSFRNIPLCVLPRIYAEELVTYGAIHNSCGIPNENNILFNVNRELITCNHLESNVSCQWDFLKETINRNDFESFWSSSKMHTNRNVFPEFPSNLCKNCNMWNDCSGGGCPITWTHYNPQDYINGWNKA